MQLQFRRQECKFGNNSVIKFYSLRVKHPWEGVVTFIVAIMRIVDIYNHSSNENIVILERIINASHSGLLLHLVWVSCFSLYYNNGMWMYGFVSINFFCSTRFSTFIKLGVFKHGNMRVGSIVEVKLTLKFEELVCHTDGQSAYVV